MLRQRMAVAVTLILLVTIAGEVFIQTQLRAQRADAHLMNIAGSQRMLSVRVAELAGELEYGNPRVRSAILDKLPSLTDAIEEGHEVIKGEGARDGDASRNDDVTLELINNASLTFEELEIALDRLEKLAEGGFTSKPRDEVRTVVAQIKTVQRAYLRTQIDLVASLERQAESRVRASQQAGVARTLTFIALLFALVVFIFRPADRVLEEFIREQEHRRTALETESKAASTLNRELEETLAKVLDGTSPICANCKSIRQDDGTWKSIEDVLSEKTRARLSHGVCEPCAAILYPELEATAASSDQGLEPKA